jgi:hypothetical protein
LQHIENREAARPKSFSRAFFAGMKNLGPALQLVTYIQ